MTAAAAPPVCAFNRFPTTVTGPDGGVVREARTVITCPDGDRPPRLLVWASPGVPLVDAELDLGASVIGRPRQTWQVVTSAGTYRVEHSSRCGCGNRLKRWTPPQLEPLRMGSLP